MAVRLEASIKRYIGLSTDVKPIDIPNETIPSGSSFFETDTWKISRFDGVQWKVEQTDTSVAERLDVMIELLKEVRDLQIEQVSAMSRGL